VALAIDSVRSLVATASGLHFGSTILSGHSAGGHLALWGAVRHRLPVNAPWRCCSPPSVDAVLALAPISDLIDTYRRDLGKGAVGELLGGDPDQVPGAYAATDPALLPLPDVPTTILHGALDDRIPVEQSRCYGARGARMVELADTEHFAMLDPTSTAWRAVLKALAALGP
jgi:pimeloyl-ACP methyl ester carboxylesterase